MHRFSFNLLPEKPKEIIQKEEKRETTSLYVALLPFLSVILAIGLMFVNFVYMQQRLNVWEKAEKYRDARIEQYRVSLSKNFEFVEKTALLREPVQKDIEPEKFFNIEEEVIQNLDFDPVIKRYGRNADGSFDLIVSFDNISNSYKIAEAFEINENILLPNIDSININETETGLQTVDLRINFFLVDDTQELI